MNDHNLDDLIIDEIEPAQSNKTKSFLTIIALAIVVLIVSIIFTKTMLKDPKQDELLFEQNETEMISPDLTLQSVTEVDDTFDATVSTKQENLLTITEEIPAAEEETKEIPRADQEPINEPVSQSAHAPIEETVSTPEKTQRTPIPASMSKPLSEEKPTDILEVTEEPSVTKTQTSTVERRKQQERKNIIHKTQSATQKRTEKTVQEQRYRPKNLITRPQANTTKRAQTGKYYIQIGAYSKAPSRRLLETISKNGFKYTITNRSPRGLRKLLIGPYSNRSSAERAFVKVKKRINKNAFLIKKK